MVPLIGTHVKIPILLAPQNLYGATNLWNCAWVSMICMSSFSKGSIYQLITGIWERYFWSQVPPMKMEQKSVWHDQNVTLNDVSLHNGQTVDWNMKVTLSQPVPCLGYIKPTSVKPLDNTALWQNMRHTHRLGFIATNCKISEIAEALPTNFAHASLRVKAVLIFFLFVIPEDRVTYG